MVRGRSRRWGWLFACAALLAGARAADARDLAPPPPWVDAREVVRGAEASLHGEHTTLVATLSVRAKPSADPKEKRFRADYDGVARRSLVRLVAPKASAGVAYLGLPPNVWTYDPDSERTRRIPLPELREPWSKSDFTLDDFVWATSLSDDYDHELLGIDSEPDGMVGRRAYLVESRPREPSPALWERILVWVDTEWGTPLRREDYDESDRLARVIRFGGIRAVSGGNFPTVWTAESPDAEGRESRIDVESVDFAAKLADSTFTTSSLKPSDGETAADEAPEHR